MYTYNIYTNEFQTNHPPGLPLNVCFWDLLEEKSSIQFFLCLLVARGCFAQCLFSSLRTRRQGHSASWISQPSRPVSWKKKAIWLPSWTIFWTKTKNFKFFQLALWKFEMFIIHTHSEKTFLAKGCISCSFEATNAVRILWLFWFRWILILQNPKNKLLPVFVGMLTEAKWGNKEKWVPWSMVLTTLRKKLKMVNYCCFFFSMFHGKNVDMKHSECLI